MNVAGILNRKSNCHSCIEVSRERLSALNAGMIWKSWESEMASADRLELSLYDLNPLPVSQDEIGNGKCRNLNHQYFYHLMFFL